jgi:hypothetical protein
MYLEKARFKCYNIGRNTHNLLRFKETKMINLSERNRNIAAAIVLILILGGVSLWQQKMENRKVAVKEINNNQINSGDVQTDVEASEQIMEQLVPKQNVETDFKKIFDTQQTVVAPQVKDADLNVVATNQKNMETYFASLTSMFDSYTNDVGSINDKIFSSDLSENEFASVTARTQKLITDLYKMPVPKEAINLQKAIIVMYLENQNNINNAKAYQADKESDEVWKKVYHDYVVTQAATLTLEANYSSLKEKYKIK